MILVDKETGQEYGVMREGKLKDGLYYLSPVTKPKPVDMSVLVESGIDCVFGAGDDTYTVTCTLRDVKAQHGGQTYRSQLDWYPYCNPRTEYWFSKKNFDNPRDLIASLQLAGFRLTETSHEFKIQETLRDGYCWPWEANNG